MKLNLGGHQRSRAILGPVAAVCALALLAGCGSGTSTASVSSSATATVNFWGWVPGLESLVANYNALHTGTTVVFHRMTGDDGTKVKAAVDAGAGPDVVQLSTHDLPDYVIAGRVVDISKYVGDQAAQYTASSWASVSFNKKVYGIPNGIGPGGLMYRTDILSKYGIAVPTTWDQYLTATRKLHAANPKVYIANMPPSEFGQWSQEIQQAGSGTASAATPGPLASMTLAASWSPNAGRRFSTRSWSPLTPCGHPSTGLM
jgi:multiple sugar transport system substrate-binding protein